MNLYNKLKSEIDIKIKDANILQMARAIHRTHKNERIIIKDNSYLNQIYLDNSQHIVIKKSVQVGVTEWLTCVSLVETSKGYNLLYVLPTFFFKNQFVQERIDKTIMFTQYYTDLINQSDKKVESTTMKRLNGTALFVGSNTPVSFIGYPADVLIVDELDECSDQYLPMAEERLMASKYARTIKVGNPKYINSGIDFEFNKSDKKQWMIKHDCGEYINIDFFNHIVKKIDDNYIIRDESWDWKTEKDINIICDKCNKPINRFQNGEWVKEKESSISGYHISSLFSSQISIRSLLNLFQEGLANDIKMQRFYNAYLGLAYTAAGAKIDSLMLDNCVEEYNMIEKSNEPTIAGIDVGKVFNIIIGQLHDDVIRIIYINTLPVKDVREIVDLFIQYNVRVYVIDAMPETRISRMILSQYQKGYGWMSYFNSNKKSLSWDVNSQTVSADRTYALDAIKEMVLMKKIILPKNSKSVVDFYNQMTSSTRIFDEKKEKYDWIESGPDHYFLAMAYLNLARLTILQSK